VTPAPSLRAVCLIGPPAAGKSTLAQKLSKSLDARVVRPRDLVYHAVGRHPAIIDLFPRNEQGYVPNDSLGFALRVTLESLNGKVILENLPWDAIQLADLHRVAGDALTILHLDAPDDLVNTRKTGRLYCEACYPTPAIDDNAGRCLRCGNALIKRIDDQLDAFRELEQHRMNAAAILALAVKLHVPVLRLEAGSSPEVLAGRAQALIERPRTDV
jgi:adenylate kinase family enzyme